MGYARTDRETFINYVPMPGDDEGPIPKRDFRDRSMMECVDNEGLDLTIGKTYQVFVPKDDDYLYELQDDNDQTVFVLKDRFK